jgi:myxalamid-type polyketide synthase MxaD
LTAVDSYPPAASQPDAEEPIALVGIGCRFPGGVVGPDSFWRLLCDGVDAIGEVPADRFDLESVYAARPATPGRIASRHGGFLGPVDGFDAGFFGLSPREAVHVDPQQRLLLEVGWEALEDGGISQQRIPRRRAGVFVGMMANDYLDLMQRRPETLDLFALNGGGRYGACGRLSFCLGLEGPSLSVDTACSSSLVAVHLACQSLRSGECELALAGGAHLLLQPAVSIALSQGNILAVDGRCKFGDAGADGFVRGEGVALVALKSLARALADGDRIYAVLRGSAVNNDGRSGTALATPCAATQTTMLHDAYRRAGVPPGQVRYVEAHGTGTAVGDRVELQALAAVLAQGRAPATPCRIGSVKTNIGHTEGASGAAGLIKLALCLFHRAIPPSLHCDSPSPAVPWGEIPLVVQREMTPWPDDPYPAFGGVNSFGLSGTNAHVVLAEPPRPAIAHPVPRPAPRLHLVPLSAHDAAALRALASAWRDLLAAPMEEGAPDLGDLAYTASLRRTHLAERLAVAAGSTAELRRGLDAFLAGESPAGQARGCAAAERPKVVFVFPGQGSQWLGMGRELLASEAVFRAAMERCAAAIEAEAGWSLLGELAAGAAVSRLGEIDVIQPTLFAIQVALAALWRSWGIEPDAVVGHSMGEIAAAHVAGALRLEDAVCVICRRSRLLRRASGRGEMAMAELTFEEAVAALRGYEDRLSVAASNSHRSIVLAGDPAALGEVLAALEARGVFCRRVKVDVASHSPQMDALRDDLVAALAGVAPAAAPVAMVSTVEARRIDAGELTADYWVRNLRQPVLFSAAVDRLVAEGHSLFLEISAHPLLLPAVEQQLRHLGWPGRALGSLRRQEGERAALLGSLAVLYAAGVAVDWQALHPQGGRLASLPSYPWQRQRFWLEPALAGAASTARQAGAAAHPLLAEPLESSLHPGTWLWENRLDLVRLPYLRDHRVRGLTLLPAAAFLEMFLAAARHAFGAGEHAVEEAVFAAALVLPAAGFRTIQTALSPAGPGVAAVTVCSLHEEDGRRSWTLHARATVRRAAAAATATTAAPATAVGAAAATTAAAPAAAPSLAEVRRRCRTELPGAELYRLLRRRGLEHGAAFQGVDHAWVGDGEALGRLGRSAAVAAVGTAAAGCRLSPALLDAALQLLLPAAGIAAGGDTHLPMEIDELRMHAEPPAGAEAWGYARVRPDGAAGVLMGDVFLLDGEGAVLVEVRGLRLRRVERGAGEIESWLHSRQWRRQPWSAASAPPAPPAGPGAGRWLLLVDAIDADHAGDAGDAVAAGGVGGTGGIGDAGDVGRALAARLGAQGETCLATARGEDLAALVRRALPCRGIVDLRALDALAPAAAGAAGTAGTAGAADVAGAAAGAGASPAAAALRACDDLTRLVQAVVMADRGGSPRLTVVTRGAWRVAGSGPVALAQTPLWGLAAVIASEHPALRCTRIDLDPMPPREEGEALFREIWDAAAEDQVALRGTERYVARLVREPAPGPFAGSPAAGASFRLRPEASYLVTGGLGALGLEIAAWMVARGARRLVLVGRQDPSAAARRRIAALAADGAEIRTVRTDVSRRAEVEALLAPFGRGLAPLAGVVHAAGVLDDGTLLQQSGERFARVMAPKAAGAWHLHESTRDLQLDFFVLFSSVAALLGSPGQGNYAAANAFLDGLAAERQRLGLPALSVAWGAWADVGLAAASSDRGERLAAMGLGSIPPALGPLALERLLGPGANPAATTAVTPLDAAAWLRSNPGAAASPFLAELAGETAAGEEDERRRETGQEGLLDQLAAALPAGRRDVLTRHVRERIGAVLKLAPAQVDLDRPMAALGFDSLMMLELRNRLEADLGVTLSAATLWNHPTAAALAAHLAAAAPGPGEAAAPAPGPGARTPLPPPRLPDVQLLSEEEALSQLLRGRVHA